MSNDIVLSATDHQRDFHPPLGQRFNLTQGVEQRGLFQILLQGLDEIAWRVGALPFEELFHHCG